jgi:beta-glucosidase
MKPSSRYFALGLATALFTAPFAFASSATTPVPRPDKWWKDRQAATNKRVEELQDKSQLIFVGDSITQGWEGAGKQVWADHYDKYNAINLGFSGDRTQHVLWRLENGNLKGLKPKAAVVMIGTNNSNGEDNTPAQIADGVRAIVEKLRESLPDTKILLVAIFPRGENPNPQRGKVLEANQIMRKLVDNKNVFWVDFGYKFLNDEGEIPSDIMPDFLHPNEKGYEIWAQSLERPLRRVMGSAE